MYIKYYFFGVIDLTKYMHSDYIYLNFNFIILYIKNNLYYFIYINKF